MNGMGRDAMRKSNKGTGRGWDEVDGPDSTQWTVLDGERWTVERENRQTCVVARSYKDGKGREEMRVSKRGGGADGTKWMAGRLLASAGGGDHHCGHFRWRTNSRRGVGEGVWAWGEKEGRQVGKDGPWREDGEQGGVDGRWGTMERG